MVDPISDLLTFIGPTHDQGGDIDAHTLQDIFARNGVRGAVTLSTRAVYYDAVQGNRETRQVCAAGDGTLLPGAVLDPRLPRPELHVDPENRIVFLFPNTQGWPITFAPLAVGLRALIDAGRARVLWCECGNPGDATQLANLMEQMHYPAPLVLGSISGANLHEALIIGQRLPRLFLCTNRLIGVGEIAQAVQSLGSGRVLFGSGAPRYSQGAAISVVRGASIEELACTQILGGNIRTLLRRANAPGTARR